MFVMRRFLISLTAAVALLPASGAVAAQRVYVAGDASSQSAVLGLAIGTDGELTPIDGWPAGSDPLLGSAISPDGTNLYAASNGAGLLSFALRPNGEVSPLGSDTGPPNLLAVAVTPDGRFVYTTEPGPGGGVRAWLRGDGGTPEILTVGSDYAGAAGLAMAPDGRHLFATSAASNGVRPFAIGSDGSLTPGAEVPAGTNPVSTAVSPDGRFLYVGAVGAGSTIRTYAIAADGSLSQVGGAQPTAGDGAYALLVSPDGRFLYVADGDTGGVGRFTLAPDGTPSQGIPDVPTAGDPIGLATDAEGRFLYAHDSGDTRVFGFSLGSGVPTALAGSPFGAVVEGNLGGSIALTPEQPPTAAFTTAVNNRRISFSGAASVDPGGAPVARYDWDFGDGATAANGGMQVTHRYGKGAKHPPVTLTVADAAGCSTAFVSDGHTPYCNGSDAATVTMKPFAPKYLGKPEQRAARIVKLRLRCPADCRVKVVGRLKLSGKGVGAKKATIRGAKKELRAGRKGVLKLRLSASAVEQASAATSAVARLKVSATDDAGNLFKDRHGLHLR